MSLSPSDLPSIESAEAHLQSAAFRPFVLTNLIDGKFAPSANVFESFNPKTGLPIAHIPNSSPEEVNQAVDAANRAFPAWSSTPPSKRSQYLGKIADLIEQRKELFAVWESLDQGKTLQRARAEVERAVSNFRLV